MSCGSNSQLNSWNRGEIRGNGFCFGSLGRTEISGEGHLPVLAPTAGRQVILFWEEEAVSLERLPEGQAV